MAAPARDWFGAIRRVAPVLRRRRPRPRRPAAGRLRHRLGQHPRRLGRRPRPIQRRRRHLLDGARRTDDRTLGPFPVASLDRASQVEDRAVTSQGPSLLEYDRSQRPTVGVIEEGPGWMRTDLGPMPDSVFIATVAPWAVGLVALSLLLMFLVRDDRGYSGPRLWWAAFGLIIYAGYVYAVARHRRVARVIEVQHGVL